MIVYDVYGWIWLEMFLMFVALGLLRMHRVLEKAGEITILSDNQRRATCFSDQDLQVIILD
jgi:hypothetical protein